MPGQPELNPLLHDRLADWGPRYTETPPGNGPFDAALVEPWNTVTASLFIWIVLLWGRRVYGRFDQYPFFSSCLPILFVGGVGGTLYHALRSSPVFFLLDILPLYGLGLLVSLFLWIRGGTKLRCLFGLIALLGLLQVLGQWQLPTQWAVNLSYASLGVIVVLPLGMMLWRTGFRDAGWVYVSFACFAVAWVFRIIDALKPLPMGTHWLWHVFGAATTWTLGEYLYRREGSLEKKNG